MRRLIGSGKPKAPGMTLDEASARMDTRVAALDQKIAQCDTQLVGIKQKMKSARGSQLASLKQQALRILKQRKMYENQRGMMDAQSFNVQQASFTQQSMQDAALTVDAMRAGAQAMRQTFKTVKVDDVEALQDDMQVSFLLLSSVLFPSADNILPPRQDLMDQSSEIQEALGRSYALDGVDEADLEGELAELGEELEADSMPSYLSAMQTPSVPAAEPAAPAPAARVPAGPMM